MIGQFGRQFVLLFMGLLGGWWFGPSTVDIAGDDPAEDRPGRPIYVILEPPADLESLLDRLGAPDVVVEPWESHQDLRRRAGIEAGDASAISGSGSAPVVASVEVGGALAAESATVEVEVVARVDGPGTRRLAVGLGGLPLSSVEDQGIPIAAAAGTEGWTVELLGPGEHRVVIRLRVPVVADASGSRIALPIPEAPVTRLALRGPLGLADVRLGDGTPLATTPTHDGGGTLLRASLPPRPLLELSWRTPPGPNAGEPLLTSRGDLAVAVRDDGIATTATYELRAARGEARALTFRLDPADRLLAVDLDGVPIESDERDGLVTVPLATPLRPDTPRKLTISARRRLPGAGDPTALVRGFPLEGFAVQSGLVAVSREGSAWVGGTAGPGLRQLDPRAELSATLRLLPSVVLGYQYFEQPFMLGLRVDSSPPWMAVESETWVRVSASAAEVAARLDYRTARGRHFELRFAVPPGLALESVGPPESVESSAMVPTEPGLGPDSDPRPARELIVRLRPEASAAGRFVLLLEGRQAIEAPGAIEVGLFRPEGVRPIGGRVSVLSTRGVSVGLGPGTDFAPASGPWGDGTSAFEEPDLSAGPPLRLDDSGASATLPIMATVHRPELSHRSTIDARIGPDLVEVRQAIDFRASHGQVARVIVAVPSGSEDSWEVEGFEVARREPLGPGPDGDPRYRLVLARELEDDFQLRFRLRGAWPEGTTPGRLLPVTVPVVRPLSGTPLATVARISADPSIRLAVTTEGWEGVGAPPGSSAVEDSERRGYSRRIEPDESGPIVIHAEVLDQAALPPVVIPRLWVTSSSGPGDSVRITARYWIETGGTVVDFELPTAATLESIRVGDLKSEALQVLPGSRRFRAVVAAGSAPTSLTILYRLAGAGGETLRPPRLLGGAIVEDVFWELRLGWEQAVLGAPDGWEDCNTWETVGLNWRRGPRLSESGLSAWLSGGSNPPSASDPTGVGDLHHYLFHRSGGPSPMRPRRVHRAVVVAGCSGAVVGLGLLLLFRKVSWRVLWAAIAPAGVALTAWLHPSVWPLFAQASVAGVALVVLAGLTRSLVESRAVRAPKAGFVRSPEGLDSEGRAGPPSSTIEKAMDASTVVRRRSGTTVDHATTAPPTSSSRAPSVAEPSDSEGRS